MNYKTLFDIQISHQYFSPESCSDIIIHPSEKTIRFLKGQHLITKRTDAGLKILIPLDENGEIKPKFADSDVMTFLVFPSSDVFRTFTDTSALNDGEIFCFTNLKLTKSSQELKASVQVESHSHDGYSCIAKVEIHPTKYLFDTQSQSKDYRLSFNAQSVKWKYYLLSSNGTTDLIIDDKQKELVFEKETLNTNTSDQIGQTLVAGYPNNNVFLFESQQPVPKTHLARKNLQLLRNGHIVINHLPNPTTKDNGVKIINMQK